MNKTNISPVKLRRPRRSIKLSKDEKKTLKAWIATFPTKYDAALALDISEQTFYRVAKKWSCKEGIYDKLKTIAKI